MTDNGSNFNHIKSAGALLLAALIVLGSVLTVAAAAAVPAEKAETENNVANSMVYNNLTDDGTFHVLSAHEVSVKNNGVIKKIVVSGGTVADALNQAGVKLGENQISVPSASTEIKSDTDIVILNAKKVSLTADGKTQNVLLPYGKVGESIILAGIRLSQDDILSVDRNTKVDDISELSIKRVIYKNVSVTEAVPFESKKENSDEIDLGDSKLKTKGVDGEKIEGGHVYIAPGGYHMFVEHRPDGNYVKLSQDEQRNGHRPSADVLFESVAKIYQNNALGVIMTGMGRDGAAELAEMRKQGAWTLGQDQASSIVYGMPKVAFELGGVQKQVGLMQMADEISKLAREHC